MSATLEWVEATINELNAHQLHNLLKLRIDVFVVEQQCVYAELDGQDALPGTQHVFAFEQSGAVVAAARVLAPDDARPVRIGRVVVTPSYRGTGLSRRLMDRVMRICSDVYPQQSIELSAQVGADALYSAYGFEVVSKVYLDDGIPHQDMRLVF